MRLEDLDPRWLDVDGVHVGFVFQSPTKPGLWWQTCFFTPTPHREQYDLVKALFGSVENHGVIQFCNPECAWVPTNAAQDGAPLEFNTLSVTPSLDGSAGGLWHGYITAGAIVGGI